MSSLLIPVVVSAVRQVTPRVREYRLQAAGGTALPAAEAGAHTALHFAMPDGPVVRHYSLLGSDGTPGAGRESWHIAVQREDRARGSAHIHAQFAVGTPLLAEPPRNHFALDWRDQHSLLVAGGIGVTPILAMARSLAARQRSFAVAYAGRERAHMAYADELQQLAGKHAHIHASAAHGGQRLDLRALLQAQPARTGIYVCGPAALIEGVREAAAALGLPAAQVRSEAFMPAADGTEVGFELVLQQSGRRLQVGPHTSILEAMTAAGLRPLHDCRRGECGLCPLSVLQADGLLQHRDRYLSAEEKAAGHSLCICVSRVRGPQLVLNA